ncbi:PREDICTED: uncharacterized protein LOC108567653 isoform X2 [Nicrophorus vespilloides]|uniref:Uncharacterized protein LOC108567653 isoform X2 n=1 Tax=Nicrophorus vespilloides TaxID=110193 RepID=A0ABM1NA88_NICVS|nr:PREDICTED: uncharacterized protein LOC108567653 isoform X2 [Nicrophorus vespilloides]
MAPSKEIKDGYTSTLQDLNCNSKPLISVLTMLAEENVAHAKVIVEAIEEHLAKVRTEVKLPVLYLIDCIIKNVGGPYTPAFCNNIVQLFCSVFQQVDEKTRTEMYKLRQTWNDVLPKSKLYALDVQTKQVDPAWPITAPPPNIHFNPKFFKPNATKEAPKPAINNIVSTATDPTTLEMQQKILSKQKQLLELQQKKLELELLQTQVKMKEEQLKKSTIVGEDIAPATAKNLLLKPEVAKQLEEEPAIEVKNNAIINSNTNIGVPKTSGGSLIGGSRPNRDPRLLRQQVPGPTTIGLQNTVNTIVQLENKSNTTNSLDNKIVSNKMSNRVERTDARFVNNKDEAPQKAAKTLSRIPLKSKRSTSPKSKSSRSSKSSSSGSGSTSSLDSPTKKTSLVRSSSKSPTIKYKKGQSRTDKKGKIISKAEKISPNKDSNGGTFKDIKGLKNRNYMRRNRISPDLDEMRDVDLRMNGPPEKQSRLHDEIIEKSNDEQNVDIDLRQIPASKKRTSMDAPEPPTLKKNKTEMFDVLFGNEDVDLRQFPVSSKSTKSTERPPTPPPPIISSSSPKQDSAGNESSPKCDLATKPALELVRAKLANATNIDKFNKSRFNLHEQKKQQDNKEKLVLDESLNKIIISQADEECIMTGNMTKAQESALMNKIIAQIENQKLKEAKRKDNENNDGTLPPSQNNNTTSDEEMDVENTEFVEQRNVNKHQPVHSGEEFRNQEGRNRRGMGSGLGGPWRGNRRGFPGPRGPIRVPRPGIEPWIRPLNPNPQWRQPFHGNIFDEEKMMPVSDLIDQRSQSPSTLDMVVNCANQDNTKSINIDGEPRDIIFYDETAIAFMTWEDPYEISFQAGTRRVTFDDNMTYTLSFNEKYQEVNIGESTYKVRLGAPTREIYIDGNGYECFFGGPGVTIDLNGKLTVVKIEGPPPQVKIGTVRRTDLVAGKINLIIDAKTIVPIYLDSRTQKFNIDNMMHTLKFTDALKTVLINDVAFKVEFGGLPKPITVNEKKHFVRFSKLPKGLRPGHVFIKDMEGCKPILSDNENSQDSNDVIADTVTKLLPIVTSTKKKSRFSDDSPDRTSSSPNTVISNLLQQPTFSNIDSLLSNAFAASTSVTSSNQTTYQTDATEMAVQEPDVKLPAESAPSVTLPPSLNINDLFLKLVSAGIVTSNNLPNDTQSGQTVSQQSEIAVEKQEPKPKKEYVAPIIKPIDFGKPNTLKIKQPAVIYSLYSGMQCSSCGMRFPPENSVLYSQHLDWHFRQNRKGKKSIRKATSRRWYYAISDWNNYEEIEDLEEREKCYFENQEQGDGANDEGEEEIEIPSVPADSNIPEAHCEVCQEKFEQFYNEEKEEWHLRMAIRIDEQTYHPLCYEDYQASLVETTFDETLNATVPEVKEPEILGISKSKTSIPGLEVGLDETKDEDVQEILIDDCEISVISVHTPKSDGDDQEMTEAETTENAIENPESMITDDNEERTENDEDDDVIIHEVQPERIILDEYEFKDSQLDDSCLIPGVTVKQEPVDDGFMDVENFKLGEIKIKKEPVTPDESFEDIGHITEVVEVDDLERPDTRPADLIAAIDGNVDINTGMVAPSCGISGKIKINISKPLPVIAPKENKDISVDVDNNIEPIDPTQPLPPGEEPVQLHLKPALQGIELKKMPMVKKGSELTGLCSIM